MMNFIVERIQQYMLLMRLHRPIGIYLLLWPTLWALWLAAEGAMPDLPILLVFVAGTVIMRSAGCVINDYADRHIDPHVKRTQHRPIAAGRVSGREALGLFIILALLAFALVLTLNRLTIFLSFIALGLAALYPFTKRYTYLPQVILGIAFGWAVPMAFAAQQNALPPVMWWLFLANLLWTVAYDTQYAMVDRDDDVLIGVKSSAILFARADRLIIAGLHFGALLILTGIGLQARLGAGYFVGLLVAAGLALYQQWLIRERDPQRCFMAFLNNHWFGAAVFAGLFGETVWHTVK